MTFALPQAFLLLIPVVLLLARTGWPRGMAGALRCLALVLVITALARPGCTLTGHGRDVVIVVDRSRSMPSGSDRHAEELIREVEKHAGSHDRTGIISFGRSAEVERAPAEAAHFAGFQRDIDATGSDLAAALHLADQILPHDREASVLVLSDGLATGSDARVPARVLAERGVPVDFRLLSRTGTEGDIAVRSLDLPAQVAPGEPFQLSASIYASHDASVPYVLRRGTEILASGTATLHAGNNPLAFRDRVDSAGLAEYSLDLTGLHDAIPENDHGRGVMRVSANKRVLVVRHDGKASALTQALRESHFDVEVSPEAPQSLAALDGVGVVVLENMPATRVGPRGMDVLVRFVRDTGGGLLMTGGRQSFGEGGYHLSVLEPVLPVSLELREEEHRAHVALGISMDRSGSMAMRAPDGRPKMALAAEGAVGALKLLSEGDEATVWVVDTAPWELFPLTPQEEGFPLEKVASVRSMGGGIFIDVALRAAADGLAKSKLETRHLILFAGASDAERPGDYRRTLERMRGEGITTSVIGMGTRSDKDAALLEEIAQLGGGKIYFADEVRDLPRLFAEDTIVLSKSSFVERPTPIAVAPDMAALGAPAGSLPAIGGYNRTYLRPLASVALRTTDSEAAPVLAFWEAGLGHAAALTAEVDGKYSGELPHWSGFRTLLSRVTRQIMPPAGGGEIIAHATRQGDNLRVTVEVDDRTAARASNATVSVLGADGAPVAGSTPLRWDDAHRLSATFPLVAEGSFFPIAQVAGQTVQVAPIALPYASEFLPRDPGEGRALLTDLAAATGGVERTSAAGIWERPRSRPGRRPIEDWFTWAALAILLAEVLIRRLLPGLGLPDFSWLPTFRWRRSPRTRSASSPATSPAPVPVAVTTVAAVTREAASVVPRSAERAPESPVPPKPDPFQARLDAARSRARNRA
jgi:uncharacterized membrane protein/Mg-chelatase subunit ChlD